MPSVRTNVAVRSRQIKKDSNGLTIHASIFHGIAASAGNELDSGGGGGGGHNALAGDTGDVNNNNQSLGELSSDVDTPPAAAAAEAAVAVVSVHEQPAAAAKTPQATVSTSPWRFIAPNVPPKYTPSKPQNKVRWLVGAERDVIVSVKRLLA